MDLLATVRDDFGQLVSGIAVTFDSELGVLNSRGSPVLSNNLGEARDRLAVSGSDITVLTTNSFVVSALAATEGGSLIEATATILIEGGAGSIVLQATPSTIPDAGAALEGMRRVLKPGGQLIFCEHGIAPDESVRKWQDRLNAPWSKVAGGCNMNRDIIGLIEASGFEVTMDERMYIPGPRILNYNFWGTARSR